MPLKKIDDLIPGEVLVEDLTNVQGAVLIKAGTVFEERHLRLLKTWGVDVVKVTDPGAEAEQAEADERLLDQVEGEIRRRFGASLDNEVMAEILRVAVELRAARVAVETAAKDG